MNDMIKFDMPKNQSSIIKVIGVGGGGSNAVNHMFQQGIRGVDFIICNTDAQSMELSSVPTKIQLGDKGLGAGSIPAVGKDAAMQKTDEIREILEKNTKMIFITAGMGGGTGTGAAPVIASIARELDILTVGIVTIPFSFEGRKRRMQAEEGIKELKQYVDTLLIISNDKLRELYGDLKLSDAFHKADDVLTTAAKGIAEIITVTGYINVDFEDVKTVMKNSGKAIMGSSKAEGENRALEAVKAALASPLLNDNEIEGASNVLLYISSGEEEISMDEVTEITDYIQREAKSQAEIIWGNGVEDDLGKCIGITLIATGFDSEKRKVEIQENIIRHTLTDEPKQESTLKVPQQEESLATNDQIELKVKNPEDTNPKEDNISKDTEVDFDRITLIRETSNKPAIKNPVATETRLKEERTFVFDLSNDLPPERTPAANKSRINEPQINDKVKGMDKHQQTEPEDQPSVAKENNKPFEVYIKKPAADKENADTNDKPSFDLKSQERIEKLRNLSMKFGTDSGLEELESQPAYLRKNVELKSSVPSEESNISRYSLYGDENSRNTELRSNNSFLHDNVD